MTESYHKVMQVATENNLRLIPSAAYLLTYSAVELVLVSAVQCVQ